MAFPADHPARLCRKAKTLTGFMLPFSLRQPSGAKAAVIYTKEFTPSKYDAWNRDLDKFVVDEMLKVLADKTGISVDRVFATTLAAYEGVLFEKHNPFGFSVWIMPVGVSNVTPRQPGLQFCPSCLAEDREPYFRRSWRLAFVALCTKHNVALLDRCAKCGSPVAFHKRLTGPKCDLRSYSITACRSCDTDLRDAASRLPSTTPYVNDEEVAFQNFLMDVMNNGWTEIPGHKWVYSHLYFDVVRRLMRLLSGGRRASIIRENVCKRYGLENFAIKYKSSRNQYIEFLDVSARRGLLSMTRELLRNWPNEFVDFCQQNKLWSQILCKEMSSPPFWFWTVIHDHLSRSSYEFTPEEITSAYNYMRRMYQQHDSIRPYRYPAEMKAVSEFLKLARMSNYYKSKKWPNMQLKANWRDKREGATQENSRDEPVPVRLIPDSLWAEIEPLLTLPLSMRGRKRHDDRKLLNGIIHVLCTDTPWQKMPIEFGSYTTVYQRYTYWKRVGVFEEIWGRCSNLYN